MSLLPSECLQVTLAPDHLRLVRKKAWWRRGGADQATLPCDTWNENTRPTWQNALAVLQHALSQQRWQKADLALTLSDRLVHYQVLPWLPELENPDERRGYAEFHYRQTYGALASEWDIQVDDPLPGSPAVACATERALLAALAGLANNAGIRIRSIQPGFARAFNRTRRLLRSRTGVSILAQVQTDNLCLGVLDGARWRALRQRAITTTMAEALRQALEQERLFAHPPIAGGSIYLLSPPELEAALSDVLDGGWTVHRLKLADEYPWTGYTT